MGDVRIELSSEDFAIARPFSFAADHQGVFRCVGAALQRRLGVEPGQRVDDVFKIVRPVRATCFADLKIDPAVIVVLRAVGDKIELKGSTISLNGGALTGFFGTAVVTDVDDFKSRGLMIGDFPPSDATPDLLLSMQATKTALDDARKLSTDLQEALVRAKAATEAKARFLAIMSHEIRTPMNGFGSMIDLLRDSGLSRDQLDNLNTMDLCAQSLLVLVNDILDFSKLEAGKITVNPEPVDLHEAIRRITEHFRATANERGIELVVDIDVGDVRFVRIDYERVRQVIANLLGNAMKFTFAGTVQVAVRIPSPDCLAIDIIDSGEGIPEEDRDGLFDPFMQADSSTTRRFGGTGLGLTISRQLATAMHGDVELVRSGETGTHFRFTMAAPACEPPATAEEVQAPNDVASPFRNKTVLIAEDDPTNRLIARKMLGKLDITTATVDDGKAAVEEAARNHYDLILMDVMMPNMSGIEATRHIRSKPGPCQNVPIIAFSAAAYEKDREAAVHAGMSGFVEKPARLDAIRKMLERYLANGS